MTDEERRRLQEADAGVPWRRWGPYLSERQWGSVREDTTRSPNSWDAFTHDQARSRCYRWGEDGLAGVSDDKQLLCLSMALWNERDPILKERLFGLTNSQGNHGEDVKEYYYYLDATPTASYLKMLYKYPQGEYPYGDLVATNAARGKTDPEYELIDTGIFDENRYFDVFVEYAKASPEDILMQVTVHNRGPDEARLHVLPTLWFRHTWSWAGGAEHPTLDAGTGDSGGSGVRAEHSQLGTRWFYAEQSVPVLMTGNETNNERVFGSANETPYVKDGIDRAVVQGETTAVDPGGTGTKAALHHVLAIPGGESAVIRMRLTNAQSARPFDGFDEVMTARVAEADEFYATVLAGDLTGEDQMIGRQALAGMIWSKQYYGYDVDVWLVEHGLDPLAPDPSIRNHDWQHLIAEDIISMPDKWEYPWFAAWDLAFHTVAFAVIDPAFAKQQLSLLLDHRYLHPNGMLPAYEWNFSDVNPPVHAWATLFVYELEKIMTGKGDRVFLESSFQKLMRNFGWWLNRKDADDRNIFQGGFLGLDNIGVFDRSAPLPTGGYINQSDGTSWMAMYSLNLMRIALELAQHNHVYEDIATKFFEHFLHIAEAMTNIGDGMGLWNEEDGFYYDVLNLPDGQMLPLKVRSMVGLIPLFAVETLEPELCANVPAFTERLDWFLNYRPDLAGLVSRWNEPGKGERRLLSLLRGSRMKKLLRRMLDESEFLSDYGVRALSRYHSDRPYTLEWNGQRFSVEYQPGESTSGLFGGNSNWRGPIWMPVNYLIIESLQKFHHYYGDDFKVECPTGSGRHHTINEVANELATRLNGIFLRNADGERPVFGNNRRLQDDPHFRNHVLFHEYFHGETGRGVGASHQTGWTGLVAKLLQPRRKETSALREAELPAGIGALSVNR